MAIRPHDMAIRHHDAAIRHHDAAIGLHDIAIGVTTLTEQTAAGATMPVYPSYHGTLACTYLPELYMSCVRADPRYPIITHHVAGRILWKLTPRVRVLDP